MPRVFGGNPRGEDANNAGGERKVCARAQGPHIEGAHKGAYGARAHVVLAARAVMDSAAWTGLSSSEAEQRLSKVGPNEPGARRRSPFVQLLPMLGNPLALVLLFASGLSAMLGQTIDASLIAAMVALSVAINLLQTWRSQTRRRSVASWASFRCRSRTTGS